MTDTSPTVLDQIPEIGEANPGTEVQPDVTPATSSPADEQGESLLDAVTAQFEREHPVSDETPAVQAETETEPEPVSQEPEAPAEPTGDESTAQPSVEAEQEPAPAETDLPDDPTEEEMSSFTDRTKRRVEKLLDQRRELHEQVQVLEQENLVATELRSFITENQISPDDWGLMMNMAADLKQGNFQGFLEKVQPYLNMAQQYVGQALPPDLQQQVLEGYIAEPQARELARLRLQQQMQGQQLQVTQQQAQQQQMQHTAENIRDAVVSWEKDIRGRDPDYAKKHSTVQRYAQAIIQQKGAPRTPQEAIAMVEQAYSEAEKDLRAFIPAPKPTTPKPNGTGSSTGARPEPQNLMEVAQQAFEDAQQA